MGAAPAVLIGTQLAGSAIQYQEAQNAADAAERNAAVADEAADAALFRGEVQAERRGQETGQITGTQKAAIASAGFDPGFGTSLDILSDTAAAGAVDVSTIRHNAAVSAHARRVEAVNQRNYAKQTRYAAPFKALAGGAAGVATGLGSYTPRYAQGTAER